MKTATMDISDYLKQGGQTGGHRELWRLLRTLFKETDDTGTNRLSVSQPPTPTLAGELVGQNVDVIFTFGNPPAASL
jgi:hypothetical protein